MARRLASVLDFARPSKAGKRRDSSLPYAPGIDQEFAAQWLARTPREARTERHQGPLNRGASQAIDLGDTRPQQSRQPCIFSGQTHPL